MNLTHVIPIAHVTLLHTLLFKVLETIDATATPVFELMSRAWESNIAPLLQSRTSSQHAEQAQDILKDNMEKALWESKIEMEEALDVESSFVRNMSLNECRERSRKTDKYVEAFT